MFALGVAWVWVSEARGVESVFIRGRAASRLRHRVAALPCRDGGYAAGAASRPTRALSRANLTHLPTILALKDSSPNYS